VHYYGSKAARKITGVSDKVLQQMMAYHWPGNIRELEHMIERSVLLAKGTMIESMPLPTKQLYEAPLDPMAGMKSIHENEREYILSVLKKCNGKIWGPGAAAEVLRIPPSTLKSKMKKLGIKKEYIE
jgi:DNA-binding NtrC family response regulator